MIRTSKQLKDKVHNISRGDSEIAKMHADKIDYNLLSEAFHATCKKRETVFSTKEIENTLSRIQNDEPLAKMWEQFRKKNFFVGDLQWDEVLEELD